MSLQNTTTTISPVPVANFSSTSSSSQFPLQPFVMGNIVYGNNLNCYENKDQCSKACGTFDCLYVDKCGNSQTHHYVCVPFDTAFIMWLLVGVFVVVVLCCSAVVVCYAIRAIRASFRNAVSTDHDIVFYNARNVHSFPHPAVWGSGKYGGHDLPPAEQPPYQQHGYYDDRRGYGGGRGGGGF